MVLQQATQAAESGGGAPNRTGVRLSHVAGTVFTERGEPLVGCAPGLMEVALASHRLSVDDELLARRGNGFITMSERLLGGWEGTWPETDAVFLTYRAPDLVTHDVAGCYLAERLPGTPVPLAVADQGVGAPFTALRIADAMVRCGELSHGALFVLDQNATADWHDPLGGAAPRDTDAAVLMGLGSTGGARVEHVRERTVDDPRQGLRDLLGEFPGVRVVAGDALLAGTDTETGSGSGTSTGSGSGSSTGSGTGTSTGPGTGTSTGPGTAADAESGALGAVSGVPAGHDCTGVWAALAARWPLAEAVVLADYEPAARRLYSCLVTPEVPGDPT
ncbi:hypothetical protein [Streptomyces sp. NBC_00094]|uniref:hypothetical protein n=1 Tax=Streptomyces sp. NBC_00094 TaxID=2903620 RepID=UPI00225047B9|nr:hypothetical protein [Streptomyces sp. NBC_00094]MCX5391925.1 hypothetical protein [Streptomyces sp. NBC_00094]